MTYRIYQAVRYCSFLLICRQSNANICFWSQSGEGCFWLYHSWVDGLNLGCLLLIIHQWYSFNTWNFSIWRRNMITTWHRSWSQVALMWLNGTCFKSYSFLAPLRRIVGIRGLIIGGKELRSSITWSEWTLDKFLDIFIDHFYPPDFIL